MTVSLILIGAGAIVAGVIGLALPPGERIAAALPLVLGAGVGVTVLAIGLSQVHGASPIGYERAFLIASAIGFAAVLAGSALLWRRRRS